MRKLSELDSGMFLFSERTDELVTVGSVKKYLDCGEEDLGNYHTVRFIDGEGITLVNQVDINN